MSYLMNYLPVNKVTRLRTTAGLKSITSVKIIATLCAIGFSIPTFAATVNINTTNLSPEPKQDTANGLYLTEGNTFSIVGNRWLVSQNTYNITEDTMLEFEFMSDSEGEIHGIGLEEDSVVSRFRIFQIYGTEAYAMTTQGTYFSPGQYQSFQIPIGQYYTGENMRVVFINDKDYGPKDNTSNYRNLRLVTPGDDYPEVIGNCSLNDTELALINAHNEARAQGRTCGNTTYNAAPKLRWDCRLGQASATHSNDMATNNFFSHTGSDGSSPFQRMQSAGYQFRTAGENIAAGYRTVEAAMSGWLSSPGHCANIMNASFRDMGAAKGESASSQYRVYWTAGFGTSR